MARKNREITDKIISTVYCLAELRTQTDPQGGQGS